MSLTEDLENAADTMEAVERAGISMKTVTDTLLEEGLRQFADAFAQLLKATGSRKNTQSRRKSIQSPTLCRQNYRPRWIARLRIGEKQQGPPFVASGCLALVRTDEITGSVGSESPMTKWRTARL